MKRLLGWLLGLVTVRITGAQTEQFLNRCARAGLDLQKTRRTDPFTLLVTVPGWQGKRILALAEQSQCQGVITERRGLPYFLFRFRRRYGLLLGLVLVIALAVPGSRTILTFDITGNEQVSEAEILSQLRLCGVRFGTYGPSVPIRAVENRMMLALDRLTFISLNLHGTRAEVIVRERDPGPRIRDQQTAADVVASATGIITHIEPWMGDAKFREGETVCKGETLIAGNMVLDPPPNVYVEDLGRWVVHAEGKVLARTWHTCVARLDLNAPGKAYTGEKLTRHSLTVMGRRMNFYKNSGIPYENYDTIIRLKCYDPAPGRVLPIVWETETVQAYTPANLPLDSAWAESMLRTELLARLEESMDQGKVLQTDYQVRRQGDVLE